MIEEKGLSRADPALSVKRFEVARAIGHRV
jgi:hypothetical protein